MRRDDGKDRSTDGDLDAALGCFGQIQETTATTGVPAPARRSVQIIINKLSYMFMCYFSL